MPLAEAVANDHPTRASEPPLLTYCAHDDPIQPELNACYIKCETLKMNATDQPSSESIKIGSSNMERCMETPRSWHEEPELQDHRIFTVEDGVK